MRSLHTETRFGIWVMVALLAALMASPVAAADNPWEDDTAEVTAVKALGGPNAVRSKPLTTVADLRDFFASSESDLRRALAVAGWAGEADDLFRAAASGLVEETTFPVGARLHWMALRRGGTTMDVLRDVRWQGKKGFDAFVLRFESGDFRWAFVIPKACGNLSLLSRMGTDELTVYLSQGTLELVDPEGNPITIRTGEMGTVSATYSDRYEGRDVGEVDIPTTIAVTEGKVQFSEYRRPVAVLITEGNEVSATMSSKGQVELAVPDSNVSDLPVRVGDAYGYLRGGVDMSVEWPAPVCVLRVTSAEGCVPGAITVDASASSVEKGEIDSVDVTMIQPDGSSRELGAPATAGRFVWHPRAEQLGTYRFEAVAKSVRGLAGVACTAEIELEGCLPPPPVCELDLTLGEIKAYDTVTIDAADTAANAPGLDRIEVQVLNASGRTVETMSLTEPYQGEIKLPKAGRYTVLATAVDEHGQRSDPYRAMVEAEPRRGFSLWALAGYGSTLDPNGGDPVDGYYAGFKGSFEQQFTESVEVSLGLGAAYDEGHDGEAIFLDLTVDWLKDWGFLGAGIGLWDITNSPTRELELILHGGSNLSWTVGGEPVQVFGEARLVPDELSEVSDAYRVLAGLRFRPW